MVIKNILWRAVLPTLVVALTACQTKTKHELSRGNETGASTPNPGNSSAVAPGAVNALPVAPPPGSPATEDPRLSKQKVAVIFGPAGFGSFAYAGFLEELQKSKLNVVAAEGIEWGALIAAIYSRKPLPFEAEWQVLKLKTDSRIEKYLKDVFVSSKVEDSPIAFACPAYDLGRKKPYLLHKGFYSELLLYCMPTLPLMPAYRNTVAHLTELDSLVEFAQSKGAGKILFVQAEPAPGESAFDPVENSANAFWLLALDALKSKAKDPIEVCTLPLSKNFSAFGDRQKMINLGKEKAGDCLRKLLQR